MTLYRVDTLDVLRVGGDMNEADLVGLVHNVLEHDRGASLILDMRSVRNLSDTTARELGDSIDANPNRPTAVVADFEVGAALLANCSSAVVSTLSVSSGMRLISSTYSSEPSRIAETLQDALELVDGGPAAADHLELDRCWATYQPDATPPL